MISEFLVKEYDSIISELMAGTLFGEPIDITDTTQLLVAAYHYGIAEGLKSCQNNWV